MIDHYSTVKVSDQLLADIKETLQGLDYGSVELYVQNSSVTQITKRHIKKTTQGVKPLLTRKTKK